MVTIMAEIIKTDRPVIQLGLPPMELAESSNERSSRCLYRCMYPALQKVFILLVLIIFSAGLYILLLKLLESTENTHNTEIILVTGLQETRNITVHQNDWEVFFQLRNQTETNKKRKKRNVLNSDDKNREILERLNDDDIDKVKEIILKHRTLCHDDKHKDTCTELISKLRSILENNEAKETKGSLNAIDTRKDIKIETNHINAPPTEVLKRETHSLNRIRNVFNSAAMVPLDNHEARTVPQLHPHTGSAPHLTDTCLLAKLLKQSYPNVHEIYDAPSPDTAIPHFDQSHLARRRYFQPGMPSYTQSREVETHVRKPHPQDIAILMGFFNKPEHVSKQVPEITSRAKECPLGSLSCNNNEDCVEEKHWCDGNVDCSDASDEIRCSCKSRVDKSRLCDGYFDCPFGEDEMGCFGCDGNTFSCENLGTQSTTCFTKEQRCNNVYDCPNQKDEIECNMLAPSLHKKQMFAISNTEGYLHRNFKGDWYAVCQNPYMWAHDACRRETGLIIRPPIIQIVPIDPTFKVDYLNTAPGGLMETSDTCFNSSAVYVRCPDFLCGTRVQTTSQLLRENLSVESHLFGRNKRFLYPYHMMYYGNRMKRDTTSITSANETHKSNDERHKRAESRVVGGKPSQPAAWPWMVAIYRNGMFHCGGVIVTQSWIISAAHCVHQFWENYYEIQVGMLRRFSFSPQEQNHRVTHVILNNHYNQIDMKNDLSLLKVDPGIQFSRWVRPICLPGPNTAGSDWLWGPAPGTICTAVGWGATVEHGPDPDHMREVEVPVWDHCKHSEDRAGKEICAGLIEGGKDACQGDSGGPLLCRNPLNSQQWYLAGIVSHGDGCARKDEPGVYTRVSLFVKWIKYHTSSKSLPLVQPIQECPGFKCASGISKCLPNIRKCDKIVDCLDAEDEINCDLSFLDPMFHVVHNNEKKATKTSREAETEANPIKPETTTDQPFDNTITTTESTIATTDVFLNNDANISRNDNYGSERVLPTDIQKDSGLAHASTIETSSIGSFEETDININTSIETTSHNALQTFSVSFEPGVLESRSSVLKKIESNEKSENKSILQISTEQDFFTTESAMTSTMETTDIQFIDNSMQENRGDSVPDEEINTENDIDSSVTEPTSSTQSSSVDNESETVTVKTLIQPSFARFNKTSEERKDLDDNNASENKINTEIISAKILPDIEEKSKTLKNIEDSVFSELQPANIRKKHRITKEFECRRIYQQIQYNRRCDRKADCEDGTDELDCTCIDYLSSFDDKLICDGVFDCSDGQDESDCYTCPENHFLCKRSEICIPTKYVCDGQSQCPLGEDESNCFALSNGREMYYDIDEKPKINMEGFLTKRSKDDWQVVCEDKDTIEQQEESAARICRYLGFSSANRYFIKYINVKEEDIVRTGLDEIKRSKRGTEKRVPVHFAFNGGINNKTARNIVIKNPQVLKEECVPNVTKTCKSLYVFCDRSLYSDFEVSQDLLFDRAVETHKKDFESHMWPWIAKVYVEGDYKCTGILIDLAWVLVSDSCLWDSSPTKNYISVILGSHRTLNSVNGLYERVHKVDAKKDLYRNRVILLHLKEPAEYSNMVKPMVIPSSSFTEQKLVCVAIGQDNNNNTISIFLNEMFKNCKINNRCFVRQNSESICSDGEETLRQWSGLISCHNEQGWYPAASFVDSRGECGLGELIVATDIENLRQEIKYYSGKVLLSDSMEHTGNFNCNGVRCGRGKCISLRQMCDGVMNCEDGNDESETSCMTKYRVCLRDPFQKGCDCLPDQMKCRNFKCISKQLFRDGNDDCGDGSDEPLKTSCSDYLARSTPSRLCDGTLHCEDRSDEDPMFCKCFAKQPFSCDRSSETNHCVAPDMVCDGVRDCPNGEDERTCIGLSAPNGKPYGTGQVIVRSHGVWHSKCYPTQNHTKSELEAICRELGFISGHAKEIKDETYLVNSNNKLIIEPFGEVVLNNQTVLKMRNSDAPIAQAVFDDSLTNCFPVFIECV